MIFYKSQKTQFNFLCYIAVNNNNKNQLYKEYESGKS